MILESILKQYSWKTIEWFSSWKNMNDDTRTDTRDDTQTTQYNN